MAQGVALWTATQRQAAAAWERWLAAAGPWHLWAQGVPLLGPGLAEADLASAEEPMRPPAARLAAALTCLADESPTLLVLDLPPVSGVHLAAALAQQRVARPLVVLGRWPGPNARLPAAGLVRALLAEARRLPRGPDALAAARHLVLVLDGERHGHAGQPAAAWATDNRYDQAPDSLPDAASLARGGIQRVVEWRPRARSADPSLAKRRYGGTALAFEHVETPARGG